jgi:hypothetical protein
MKPRGFALFIGSVFLVGLAAGCAGSTAGLPVQPRHVAAITVSLVGRPPLASTQAAPAPLGVMSSALGVVAPLSVTEEGYSGTFEAHVVSWNAAVLSQPCLAVVPRPTPNLVWITNPGPCVYDGTDVESIVFTDPFGNAATQYFQIVPGPHPHE